MSVLAVLPSWHERQLSSSRAKTSSDSGMAAAWDVWQLAHPLAATVVSAEYGHGFVPEPFHPADEVA
jgi:hypothetical protein